MNDLKINFTCAERFLKYVKVDTQSDHDSNTFPSTEKQKDLAVILVQELKEIGVQDIEMDEYGYVYATIPSNTKTESSCDLLLFAHGYFLTRLETMSIP